MQLVQEGKITLDEPIETYLPGLIHGEGIDGTKITVRQLLQHTSGLPEYHDTLVLEKDIFQVKDNYYSHRDLLDVALGKPAAFEPGSQFHIHQHQLHRANLAGRAVGASAFRRADRQADC